MRYARVLAVPLICLPHVSAAPDLSASARENVPSVEVTMTRTEFKNLRECEENRNPVTSMSGTISLPTTDENLCMSGMQDFEPFAYIYRYYGRDDLFAACDMETGSVFVTGAIVDTYDCQSRAVDMEGWTYRYKELVTPGGGGCFSLQTTGGSERTRYEAYSRFDYVDNSGDNYAGVCGRTGPSTQESVTTLEDIDSKTETSISTLNEINTKTETSISTLNDINTNLNDMNTKIEELEVTMIELFEARRRRKAAENVADNEESGGSRAMGSTMVITFFAAILGGLF